MELRAFELSEREWTLAEQLRDVLEVIPTQIYGFRAPLMLSARRLSISQILKDATLFFSRDTPNLAMVIPAMDHIDEVLSSQSLDRRYDVSIRASLGLAKKTLNRYYSITDMSEVYRIAMGMYLMDLSTSSANCVLSASTAPSAQA